MIEFHYECDFALDTITLYSDWINRIIESEDFKCGDLSYIFCDDEYLHSINFKYLNHDTYTDIITFDYTENRVVSGDVFISVERVKENTKTFDTNFKKELLRVMSHGVLHLMGYGDKGDADAEEMRIKEEEKIKLFHVEP